LTKISKKTWKERWFQIIFEADTSKGRTFDIVLMILILISVTALILSTVESFKPYANLFEIIEWGVTILFSIEYILRLIVLKRPSAYVFSFWGIIDFLSTIPKYLSYFLGFASYLTILRTFRLIRIFRILDLGPYIGESHNLSKALKASKEKIFVFLFFVLAISVILGTIMYWVEGPEHGFTNIPKSIYWTIVTLTTVGYGDIAPQTGLGQFIASFVMIMGFGIIAVPTGIVTAEYTKTMSNCTNTKMCRNCGEDNHQDGAKFCHECGETLIIE